MTNDLLAQERSLSRCIERLQDLIKTAPAKEIHSALHFTGTLLEKYLQRQDNQTKAKYYYDIFERQINLYRMQLLEVQPSQGNNHNRLNGEIMREVEEILEKHRHFKKEMDEGQQLKKALKEKQEGELLNQLLQRIRKCYADHNIDGTWEAVQALRIKAKASSYLTQRIQNQLQEQFTNYQQEYLKMHRFYSNFDDSDGWIFDKIEKNVKLQYKVYEEERTIAVRVDSEIDIEILPFMAIACEIGLVKYLMPFVESSQQLMTSETKAARNLKVGFSSTKVPLLAERECYYYAIGYDRIKTAGSIFIYCESFEDNLPFQQKINHPIDSSEDKVYLKVHYYCLEYRPISKSRAQVRIVTKADFKLSFLPLFILTATARIFMFDYFQNVVKKAREFKGSKWEEKVKSNPAMYDFFQSKINEYFGQ